MSESVSLGISAALLTVLVVNRVLVPPELLYDSQSRTDLLGLAGVAAFALNSLTALEVTSREADVVELDGIRGRGVSKAMLPGGAYETAADTVAWAADSLLAQTPAETLVLAWRGQVLHRQGVLPKSQASGGPALGSGPIALKAAEGSEPVYLANLQALPGRVEFTAPSGGGGEGGGVLPANTQSAVVLALGDSGLLVLGAAKARAFTQRDLADTFLLAQPVARALERASPVASVE